MVLIVEDIDMPSCEACTCDYLEIQNGLPSDAVSSGIRCGNRIVTFYSNNESMTLVFFSDWRDNKQYRGFKATYTQVNYTNVTTGQ